MKTILKEFLTGELIKTYKYSFGEFNDVDVYFFYEGDYKKAIKIEDCRSVFEVEEAGIDNLNFIDGSDNTIISESEYLEMTNEERKNCKPDYLLIQEIDYICAELKKTLCRSIDGAIYEIKNKEHS